ncbi:MAG: AAA family ATPase [Chloroflexi bacterium GWB2_49_20]|nr:MAG: AAA family ATPase [Chloroflexi bacterium GWB2_49_20]OGN80014.1 MAG: AAA family ATPase [Chloroflexi bacterium GWC2_49_37]OGN85450.1 MAG: AAA family ATPase [Chloroflexi bacterium GWD2_49_16]HBG74314.1 AAA family ATPase [Anaerolineae bacterium]HCM97076.1 AAA family ATPase [Anaerolineae bacterium]
MEEIQIVSTHLIENLEKVIVGKRNVIEMVIVGLLCQGHILIEDVPGVGKTVLARSLARSLGCTFSRLQFTPDMLPSDVTGVSVYNQATREFEFRPGPIFAQIVLVDEINRATPKTQAALLEAMEERQVTVDGITHLLPRPFMVAATQNPIEYEGTFPLPEAQLDRFLLRIKLGYPSQSDEVNILEMQQIQHPYELIGSVVSEAQLLNEMEVIKKIYVSAPVKKYIVNLVSQTRQNDDLYLGASPRGSLALFRTGQALAFLRGRNYVLPDDIKNMAPYVLSHRVIVGPSARLRELSSTKIIEEILENVPVPGGVYRDSVKE